MKRTSYSTTTFKHNNIQKAKATEIVPLFIFMSQKEVLHLLSAEVDLVLIVAFNCLSLIHRIIQGQQELLKGFHYGRGWTQIHVMDVTEPNETETSSMEVWTVAKFTFFYALAV